MQQRDTIKTIIAALFTIYFLWCAYAPENAVFLHLINLPIHEAGYAKDAIVMQLPLLSGLTGAEGGFHDWNYLLSETGLLGSTQLIAKMLRFSGTVLIVAAAIGSFIYATKGEKIVSDIEL